MNSLSEQLIATAGPAPRASFPKFLAAMALLAIGVGILAFAVTSNNASNRDFICYWAAGQQLVHHGNPYDGTAILRLERSAGFQDSRPFFMRNPPLAFFLAWPLGLVGARVGAVLWSLALIAALKASLGMIWTLHGRPRDRLHLVGYCFPPALACLLAGQIGIFLLLGITLFLYLHRSRPFLAGVSLLLCTLKPQLFLPCCVALLAWIIAARAYSVLLGATVALMASTGLSWALDPLAWHHYAQMARAARLQDEFIPTVSLAFRLIVHRDATWLQMIPVVAGSGWALSYFWKHRSNWNWMRQGCMVLLVSVLVAPYAWFTDETVLLPAMLAGLYRVSNAGRSLLPFASIAGVALVQVLAGSVINSGLYIWTAPAWLAWYVITTANLNDCARSERTLEPPTEEPLSVDRSQVG